MPPRSFEIQAVWDAEANVWYSKSNVVGLHVEADTLEEFERIVREEAADIVYDNYLSKAEIDRSNLKDFIPTIFLRPAESESPAA